MGDIVARSPLVLVNTNEFVMFPTLKTARIVEVGGHSLEDPAEPVADSRDSTSTPASAESALDDDESVDNSTDSPALPEAAALTEERPIILFSLGAKVRTDQLPPTFMDNLVQTFAQLKEYEVVARVSAEDTASRQKLANLTNVRVFDSVPQKETLGGFGRGWT